ncbi:MAG TPA: hypothetical protein VFL62_01285 [Bradyrhizobium sp.]|uniref:hypothetical protein n=1 Tax=Bradyrhizobium sp. TaxID=376 RepID=UPI002D7E8CB1|nr:hypothetical protein [Bradyrhizobium sp.]HET7884835.1 hypothetical protein [Bradyrhizobium sp.]
MTTIDIVLLVVLTVLFVAFAATMAWAEVLLRRLAAAHRPAHASNRRKRRAF